MKQFIQFIYTKIIIIPKVLQNSIHKILRKEGDINKSTNQLSQSSFQNVLVICYQQYICIGGAFAYCILI